MASGCHNPNVIAEAEKQLTAWGQACRDNSHVLGLPRVSGIAVLIDHVRAEEKVAKVARRKRLRAARKAWRAGDPPIDSRVAAEELGYIEPGLTAKGKQTKACRRPPLTLNSGASRIDVIVASLAGWAKTCIYFSYLYGQPDRIAARTLRMPSGEYSQRRRAAVEMVAFKVQERQNQRRYTARAG